MDRYGYYNRRKKSQVHSRLTKGEALLLLNTLSLCMEDNTEEIKQNALRLSSRYLKNRGFKAGSLDEMIKLCSAAVV